MTAYPWRPVKEGLEIHVKVTPKAASAAVQGIEVDDAGQATLKVRVTAVPEDGAANTAVQKLLAKLLGCAPSRMTLKTGATARRKTFVIEGDTEVLQEKCMALWGY